MIQGQLGNIIDTGSVVDLGPVVCIEAGSVDASTEDWEDTAVEVVYGDGPSSSYGPSSTGEPRLSGPGECL